MLTALTVQLEQQGRVIESSRIYAWLLDRDRDSASLVTGFDESVGVDDPVHWVGCPEDRGEGAGVDEGGELLQASGDLCSQRPSLDEGFSDGGRA